MMRSPSLALIFVAILVIVEASIFPRSLTVAAKRLEPRLRKIAEKVKQNGESTEAGKYAKYFKEAGINDPFNHYDARFVHGVQSSDDRQDTQLHMIRAYLMFFQQNKLETWLAHGTLLGWWWNGKMLPWDWDIDTQVSFSTLLHLGRKFNSTIYDYSSANSAVSVSPPVVRQYLLDVNPAMVDRDRDNGDNVIDARWIDIRNGLYIDITAVAETRPKDMPGVWSCKNYHRYKMVDLYPMRESIYEGVLAKVPYAYDRILGEEYQEKALVVTEYEGHRWHSDSRQWIKKTAEEIRQDRANQQTARRKKQEEKADERKLEQQRERMAAIAKDNLERNEGARMAIRAEPKAIRKDLKPKKRLSGSIEVFTTPKRDAKVHAKRQYWADLERESSGLKHLRNRGLRRSTDEI